MQAIYGIIVQLASIVTILASLSMPCLSAEIKGVRFKDQVLIDNGELKLHGLALLKWARFFDVYAGAFYLPGNVAGSRWMEDLPKRLELSYFREIESTKFAEASDNILRENLSPEEYGRLAERLTVFYGFFRDVKPGDRYSISYIPGNGSELRLNDKVMGRIPGHDFAAAYFGVWLGEKPINIEFRDRLLRTNDNN